MMRLISTWKIWVKQEKYNDYGWYDVNCKKKLLKNNIIWQISRDMSYPKS